MRSRTPTACLGVLLVLVAACGSGGETTPSTSSAVASASSAAPLPTAKLSDITDADLAPLVLADLGRLPTRIASIPAVPAFGGMTPGTTDVSFVGGTFTAPMVSGGGAEADAFNALVIERVTGFDNAGTTVDSGEKYELGAQVTDISPTVIASILPMYFYGKGAAHPNSPIYATVFGRRTQAEYAGGLWEDPANANIALGKAAPALVAQQFAAPIDRVIAGDIVRYLRQGYFTWVPTPTGLLVLPEFPHVVGDWIPVEFPNEVIAPLLSEDGKALLGLAG